MIDFLEVQEQMREYRTGLQSTLDQDHEGKCMHRLRSKREWENFS